MKLTNGFVPFSIRFAHSPIGFLHLPVGFLHLPIGLIESLFQLAKTVFILNMHVDKNIDLLVNFANVFPLTPTCLEVQNEYSFDSVESLISGHALFSLHVRLRITAA